MKANRMNGKYKMERKGTKKKLKELKKGNQRRKQINEKTM